jgi:hypothetical protein
MEALLVAHALTIQVVSTTVACLATVVLAVLTGKYVRQTRTMAESAVQQVEIMRATLESARQRNGSALRATAQRLRTVLAGLDGGPSFDQLRTFNQITDRDLADLEELAKEVGGTAPALAAETVRRVRPILEIRDDAAGYSVGYGWLPKQRQVDTYQASRAAADAALAKLEGFLA